MPSTETRVFESVDSSPETVAANKAYFEGQGVVHEAKTSDAADAKPPVPAPATPPAGAAPVVDDEEAELTELEKQVEEQSAAAGGAANPDGKKKENSVARVRRERRELKAANEKLEKELADLKAAKPPEAAATEVKPPAGTPAAAAPAADAGAPPVETFPEAEPAEPKYEDFAAEEDQLLAYQRATTKYAKDWGRWDRKREAFDIAAANKAAVQTTEVQQRKTERLSKLNERLVEVRAEYADFDATLKNGEVLSPALSAAATVVPGGLKAAYLLAKDPAKLKEFNEKTAAMRKVDGKDVPTQDAYDVALFLLGQVVTPLPGAAAAAAPAATIPSAAPPPREELPAPTPARGRAENTPRRTDLSGDARRDMLARDLNP